MSFGSLPVLNALKNDFVLKRWVLMAIVFAMACAVTYDATLSMIVLWITTDTYMHGSLVLPLAFIMAKHKPWPAQPAKPLHWVPSVFVLLAWASMIIVGKLSMLNVVQQIALLSVIPVTVLLCYGHLVAWHYRAPLILLFFAVPVGDFMIPFLQSITADMAVWMLQMTGVSVLRNGWYISIPAADFRVAEACSGINFLISTFTVAVFYAFTYMDKIGKRVAFIVMGLLVPIAANGLRVYLIIMIAHWGNVEAATGFDHLVYGWIFFAVILIALFVLGRRWQDPPQSVEEGGVMMNALPLTVRSGSRILMIFFTLVVVYALYVGQTLRHDALPHIEPQGVKMKDGDRLSPQFPSADFVSVKKVPEGFQYHVYYRDESPDKKLIGYQNRWFDGKIWSIDTSRKIKTDSGIPLSEWTLTTLSGKEMKLIFSYCVGGKWNNEKISVKMAQVSSRLLGTDFGGQAFAWFVNSGTDSKDFVNALPLDGLCKL